MTSGDLQPATTATVERAPDDRATDFKAVTGDTGEHFNGYTLMVEAYAAIWIILFGWFFFLWRKQTDLAGRVDGLEAALARAEKKVSGAAAAPKAKPADKAAPAKAEESA